MRILRDTVATRLQQPAPSLLKMRFSDDDRFGHILSPAFRAFREKAIEKCPHDSAAVILFVPALEGFVETV